jgi:heme-degrading monooxygenase HmoA
MYHIVWEFVAKEGQEEKFRKAYGPSGAWVKFFRTGKGFISTILLRDVGNKRRFLTIDEWTTKTAYAAFRTHRAKEYMQIDQKCSALTESEALIGSFATAGKK